MSQGRSSQFIDLPLHRARNSDYPAYVSTRKLEIALTKVSKRVEDYESQMKSLESELSEGLSNFRAIESKIQESYTSIQKNTSRAERALKTQVPHIKSELDESLNVLSDLSESLPVIQQQVAGVRLVYESGRQKAQALTEDLTWLNTEFYERWRRIIFTSTSPVSWRWKTFMRLLFALSFVVCSYLLWLLVSGAYRAHRHRLVWGERLMS